MCGIAGILLLSNGAGRALSSDIDLMMDSISHRGPDSSGKWNDNDIYLGHRRLAIIDMSADGNQPMQSSDSKSVIVFNGEIYNFKELRKDLEERGYIFRGSSDTEVLLGVINEYGFEVAINMFIGMFAFAYWDRSEKKLFLARDRAGKKPLYYCVSKNKLYFASEIKAFKKIPDISLSTNHEAIHHYLTLGFIPGSKTIYNEINEVLAGQWMIFNSNGCVKQSRYWIPPKQSSKNMSFNDAVIQTESLLKDSIRLRLRSDVPVGIFLSGGIDSGLITAIAAEQSSSPINTYTVSFDDDTFDESDLAKSVSNIYKTNHQIIKLNTNFHDLLPKVVQSYDEPFADPSALPTYAVSEAASKELKVVLNGEGADELFGGYRRHAAIKYAQKVNSMMGVPLSKALSNIFMQLPSTSIVRSKYGFLRRFARGLAKDSEEQYLIWSSDGLMEDKKNRLWVDYNPISTTEKFLKEELEYLGKRGIIRNFFAKDFIVGMGHCLLVKMDIATMAHGLEARSPFLDHRIADFAFELDYKILIKGLESKPILRELARTYLPKAVHDAPKRGFEIPLINLIENDLKEMIHDTCFKRNGILSEYFSLIEIKKVINEKDVSDRGQWAKQVWILFMLGLWDDLT